jgi:hypothetical protein
MPVTQPSDQEEFVKALLVLADSLETEPIVMAVGGRSSLDYARHMDVALLREIAQAFEKLCSVAP